MTYRFEYFSCGTGTVLVVVVVVVVVHFPSLIFWHYTDRTRTMISDHNFKQCMMAFGELVNSTLQHLIDRRWWADQEQY